MPAPRTRTGPKSVSTICIDGSIDLPPGAVQAAIDDGLSRLTFGRLAKRLGISDRIVVYYFPTKDDLITEVLLSMGSQLQDVLGEAVTTSAADHIELLRAAWPVLLNRNSIPRSACCSRPTDWPRQGESPTRPWPCS